jgi:hypothetical protein
LFNEVKPGRSRTRQAHAAHSIFQNRLEFSTLRPRGESETANRVKIRARRRDPTIDGETILVLEKDRGRLFRYEEILAALGYEPVGFTTLREVALADAARARFDAALVCHQPGIKSALDLVARYCDESTHYFGNAFRARFGRSNPGDLGNFRSSP